MCPVRAPKLQLAVEQPSTGGCRNPPKKDTPCPKTKKKLQQDGRRGAIMIISNPIPLREWPTDWRTIIPKKLSHSHKDSEPHIWLSSLRIWQWTGNPQGIWPWGSVGLDYRTPRGLRETETPVLGTKNILCTPSPRGEEQWPHRRLNQNYLLMLEGIPWRRGSAGLTIGMGALEGSPLVSAFLEFTINPYHRAGLPQAKLLGREYNPIHQQIIELKL